MFDQDGFNRQFRRTQNMVSVIFTVVAVLTVATIVGYVAVGISAYRIGSEGTGQMVGQFLKGVQEGQQ